ncbi:RNA polymerase sigma factor sigA-like isoform X1 [Durio zibethinus]|uniref:RNA polymerase sigma factor sigA-like isoform X1 n=1 Tax=Durio zibethinus TaxID=66656 RepID=A0A6P5YPP9_DURZI|nr:RNA polymerase sigma factor sigA-like isoform X1 [Durio zibethinus]XP_022742265.1 RNA polymerase sigma factor sigA-like isoform X1 [Durio zibethinus]XP_022742266.1 RNA polymerase sigma factor sigA-like isoform X1 [Durio zibethinus]
MMATAAVIGLSTGKRLLSSSFFYSDNTEKLSYASDYGSSYYQTSSTKSLVVAKKLSNCSQSLPSSNRRTRSIKALKEHVDSASVISTVDPCFQGFNDLEEESYDLDYSVEALLLLQKSMLEKQWTLSFESTVFTESPNRKTHKKIPVTCSGVSARQRRLNTNRKILSQNKLMIQPSAKHLRSLVSPELLQSRFKGYVRGVVSEELLGHAEVVRLSKKIKAGLSLEDHRLRLKERLGCEPSDEQLATSLKISRAELQSKLIECSLAREKLAMSNVRLVMSIAQRYDNMGAEMSDLIQGGLIGLLRGIEKFDSSKGYKISTYVYWWILQGVSRALVENSKTLRLPTHLHERLGLIRNAKNRLKEKGITPTIDRIAKSLNMSQKKVRNATEAVSKVFSLDRDAFPSLNGIPGETHHSYVADNRVENIPWHGVDEWALKDEVNKLITTTLGEREREIIRLYYGLDKESLTWEDISKCIGLSRERVRQVGLVALEKLKHAARKNEMEALLLKH